MNPRPSFRVSKYAPLVLEIIGSISIIAGIMGYTTISNLDSSSMISLGSISVAIGSFWFWKMYDGDTLWSQLTLEQQQAISHTTVKIWGNIELLFESLLRIVPTPIRKQTVSWLRFLLNVIWLSIAPLASLPLRNFREHLFEYWDNISLFFCGVWTLVSGFLLQADFTLILLNISMGTMLLLGNGVDYEKRTKGEKSRYKYSSMIGGFYLLVISYLFRAENQSLYQSNSITGLIIVFIVGYRIYRRRYSASPTVLGE